MYKFKILLIGHSLEIATTSKVLMKAQLESLIFTEKFSKVPFLTEVYKVIAEQDVCIGEYNYLQDAVRNIIDNVNNENLWK